MDAKDLIANIALPRIIDFDELHALATKIVGKLTSSQIGRMYNHYVVVFHPLVDDDGHPYARNQFDNRFYPVSKEKWLANLPDQVSMEMRLAILAILAGR